MVRRGRVDGGRTVGLSWATREDKLTALAGKDAAEASGGPESGAGGVYV